MASDTIVTGATVENRLTTLETNFAVFVQEMKDFKDEMKDFRQEMRDRDNRRAEEIAEIRADIKEIYKTTDAKIDGMSKHIRNLSYASIGAIAAMVITVLLNLPK